MSHFRIFYKHSLLLKTHVDIYLFLRNKMKTGEHMSGILDFILN